MMLTGGGTLGGIHGKHMGPGVEIHYAAKDSQRQTIPWVEYRNRSTGETHNISRGWLNPSVCRQLAPLSDAVCRLPQPSDSHVRTSRARRGPSQSRTYRLPGVLSLP